MFEYAVRVLHMSDSEAGLRLHAARFARKFPDSLEMLSRGELHLTAMKLLSPVLTPKNTELLKMSCLKTKQEIQLLIAKHCPQPDVPDAVRRLPPARSATATCPGDSTLVAEGESTAAQPTCLARSEVDRGAGTSERPLLRSPASHPSNREPAVPISEGRYKIRFTASQRVHDLLQEAQDLFRNQLPNGDINVLFERALVLLVSERKKQLYAQTNKPRRSSGATSTDAASTPKPNSRHIPSAIKRRVYARDKGQCRFVSPTGERCCARSRLEFHHIQAFGFGGPPTEKNIVLFCRAHNVLMAERDYSREHIQHCIQASQTARTQASAAKLRAQATTRPTQAQPTREQLTHARPSDTQPTQAQLTREQLTHAQLTQAQPTQAQPTGAQPTHVRPTHAQPTHAAAPQRHQLSTPQYKPTRSGISESRERSGGLNQPRARNPNSQRGLDD
jgi:5-methylcytosine-specific restriction endonuclease McrA